MALRLIALSAAFWGHAVLAGDPLQCSPEFGKFVVPKNVPSDLAQQANTLATNVMRTIEQALQTDFNYVSSVVDLFVSVPKTVLDGWTFHRFTLRTTAGGFFKTAMRTTEFLPRVLQNNTDPAKASLFTNRTTTEADPWWASNPTYQAFALHLRGDAEYVFLDRPSFDEHVVRPIAEEYYPVHYIEPVAGNELAAGFDTIIDPVRRNAIKTAERLAARLVTGRVRLAQSVREEYGFVIWAPVFQDMADPSRFTLPRLKPSVPLSGFWPAGFICATYVVQELLQQAVGIPSLSSLAGPAHAGASIMTLVFQKLGYPDTNPANVRQWEFLAGFSNYVNVSNTTFIEAFNRDWKNNREWNLNIVAHEIHCGNITVDEAGSQWHVVFAVDYGCQEGEFLVQAGVPGQNLSVCAPCPPGLYCSGLADKPTFEVPVGFFAPPWDQMVEQASVYQCHPASACPGGAPGVCAGGRVGIPCAECPAGDGWNGSECLPCSDSSPVAWAFVLLGALVGLAALYYVSRGPLTEKPSISMALSSVFGVGISLLQILSIVRLVPMSWPLGVRTAMQGSSFVMLDGQTVGTDCVIGPSPVSSYLATGLIMPAAIVCLIVFKFLSGLIPARFKEFRWAWPETLSAAGLVARMVFTTLCNIALIPFMCYKHPNGKHSVLKYSGVICGEGTHAGMEAFGVLLILSAAAFVVVLMVASWMAPFWSVQGDAGVTRLRAIRFLLQQFRGDAWWYGTFLVLRGLALSLPVALATDSCVAQLLALCFILLTSLALQVYLWPWKVPLVNVLDALVTMLVVMLICWGIFYAPHVQEGTMESFDQLGLAEFSVLICAVITVLLVTLLFFMLRRAELCSAFALGKPPDVEDLAVKLDSLAAHLNANAPEASKGLLQALSVYDIQSVARVTTILGHLSGGLNSPQRSTSSGSGTFKSQRVMYSSENLPKMSAEGQGLGQRQPSAALSSRYVSV